MKKFSRISENTIILISQKLIIGIVSIILTPVLLKFIGVENFGLYAVGLALLGGISFVNWALNTSTQRYISVSLGMNNVQKLNEVLTASFVLHLGYAIFLVMILSVMLNLNIQDYLTIPTEKTDLFRTLFVYMGVASVIGVITIPFIAYFRAHERFLIISIVALVEPLVKLLFIMLVGMWNGDLLLKFSLLILVGQLLIFIIYFALFTVHRGDARVGLAFVRRTTLKDMATFIQWNVFGALVTMSRNQGTGLILNRYFGLLVNSAYAIALQVNAIVLMLAQSVTSAATPQLMKEGGGGNDQKMLANAKALSANSFILTSNVALPILLNLELFLSLWLGEAIPDGTDLFITLVLFLSVTSTLSGGIQSIFMVINRVKEYNLVVGSVILLNVPLATLLFWFNLPSYLIIVSGIFLEFVAFILRIYLLRKYIKFDSAIWFWDHFLRMVVFLIVYVVVSSLDDIFSFGNLMTLCVSLVGITIYVYMSKVWLEQA